MRAEAISDLLLAPPLTLLLGGLQGQRQWGSQQRRLQVVWVSCTSPMRPPPVFHLAHPPCTTTSSDPIFVRGSLPQG